MLAKVAFTGGGTGGHIYPGLAVAEALREACPDAVLSWIGNESGMDRGIIEAAGLPFYGVPAGKLRRDLSLRNLPDAFRVASGYLAARGILKRLKPDILFSKGGYVSVPPCAAARSLGIPVFTHESDVNPGLATRLNARLAERIFVSYGETIGYLPPLLASKATVSGNPVRASILAGNAERGRAFLGFPPGKPVALFLGGSQGARELNELVAANLDRILRGWRVAHQTGAGWEAAPSADDSYRSFPYLHAELADVLAAADLVVGRSGAGTLWESASLAKPMLLLPLRSSASRGDQVVNAKLFESRGAAMILPPAPDSAKALVEAMEALSADPARRAAMGAAARAIAGESAARALAREILHRIGEKP